MSEGRPNLRSRRMNDQIATRKRLLRPCNVVRLILLAVIGVIAYSIIWALTVRPHPSVDYAKELIALSAASQPPGENAWPHLVKAGTLCQEITSALTGGSDSAQNSALDFGALLEDQSPAEAVQLAKDALSRLRA